ncbi:MAG: 50S ribosomal protein L11 [Nanoarchaeota archaeon]
MIIKLLIDGGSMTPGPAIAQQLGPMGINMGKVISDINKATMDFKGMKVPVELDVNEKTKNFVVRTSSPPTSELLKKELKLEKGTADHKKSMMGNASIEDIIKVTKIKFPNMLQKEFISAVKSVLGTCRSIGIFVENKNPNDLAKEIEIFKKEILSQSTETSAEKRKELDDFFAQILKQQETIKKAEEVAAAEKEAAATAEKATAKPGEAKPGEEAKAEVKPGAKPGAKPAEAKTAAPSAKAKPAEKKK